MSRLPLESLEIRNFRLFEHLVVERLDRVNLIVGKNNVGKSTLLEALNLYSRRSHSAIWQLLSDRTEAIYSRRTDSLGRTGRVHMLQSLFFRQTSDSRTARDSFTTKIGELRSQIRYLSISLELGPERSAPFATDNPIDESSVRPRLLILPGGYPNPVIDRFEQSEPMPVDFETIGCVFISSRGIDTDTIEFLWSQVALTDAQEIVIKSLQIIEPSITDVTIIANPENAMRRSPFVKLRDSEAPLPIESLGDGLNRVFVLSLALIASRGGILLVDEIGTGLHYSTQLALWQLIFTVSATLEVQVFATTHSDDTVKAFQIASSQSEEDGLLIRLERRGDKISAVLFDEKRLAIASEQDIEVR